MITREVIRNGFDKKLISIEEEYNGCIGLCCRIGEIAFYFIGDQDSDLTVEEYWKSYTLDMTVDMIYNILKDVRAAEDIGIDYIEYCYYKSILLED